MSIAYATRLGLGPTNPGTIIVAQETLLFRWAGFSPALWLLIPAFSLDNAPPNLAVRLQRRYLRSSTTPYETKPAVFSHRFAALFPFSRQNSSEINSHIVLILKRMRTTNSVSHEVHIFGITLSPVTFSAQGLLMSELLRTL